MRQREIANIFTSRTVNGFIKKHCGELLGTGAFRDVYVLKQDSKYVVKIERNMIEGYFANVTEWRNYINYLHYKSVSKWLAPCMAINETGQILIQRRVVHKPKDMYPKKIPSFFTDVQYSNFGFIGDKFVCCDYAFFITHLFTKMKKTKFK